MPKNLNNPENFLNHAIYVGMCTQKQLIEYRQVIVDDLSTADHVYGMALETGNILAAVYKHLAAGEPEAALKVINDFWKSKEVEGLV